MNFIMDYAEFTSYAYFQDFPMLAGSQMDLR